MTAPAEIWWSAHRIGSVMLAFTDARTDLGNRKVPGNRTEVGNTVEQAEDAAVRTPQEQQAYLQELLGESLSAHLNTDLNSGLNTNAGLDLDSDPGASSDASGGVISVVSMNQVHGNDVALAQAGEQATADALVVDQPGVAAVVRVADCVPIVLADPEEALAAVVHAGRVGMAAGVIENACEALRQRGARNLIAWLGPRACGSCYEVPADMRAEVSATVPAAFSTTSWGTPALDIGAGVRAQLEDQGFDVHDLGAKVCTIEDERFWSYRRQGAAAGRFGAVVTLLPRTLLPRNLLPRKVS